MQNEIFAYVKRGFPKYQQVNIYDIVYSGVSLYSDKINFEMHHYRQ